MRRSIWYISKYVATPQTGGVGQRGYLIMRELARMGHNCLIITSDSNQLTRVPQLDRAYRVDHVDGLTLCWVKTMKYAVAKSMRRILSWLDFEWRLWRLPKSDFPRPDAVIVSSLSLLTIFNGLLLRRKYGCKLVFEIRDIWPLTITEEGGFSRWNPLVLGLGFVEWLGYRQADLIVGTMPNLGEHVAEVLGYAKPTHCIPMGIDPEMAEEAAELPDGYVEQYIPADKFIVAYVGTVGITNALEAFVACAEQMRGDAGVHFLVVGDGDLREGLMRRCAALPNITFAPRIEKRQVPTVLEYADLLFLSVFPSRVWKYGQSMNKVIDYMLSAKPIVASYSGYPSMINEARCGVFVPPGDTLALQDQIARFQAMPADERAGMGARGRHWVLENRPYSVLAMNYLKLLEAA